MTATSIGQQIEKCLVVISNTSLECHSGEVFSLNYAKDTCAWDKFLMFSMGDSIIRIDSIPEAQNLHLDSVWTEGNMFLASIDFGSIVWIQTIVKYSINDSEVVVSSIDYTKYFRDSDIVDGGIVKPVEKSETLTNLFDRIIANQQD